MKKVIYGGQEISGALYIMACDIISRFPEPPVLIGIRRGGVVITNRLAELLAIKTGQKPDIGIIDINLYRDDWTKARSLPEVGRTDIPINLDNRRVILIDDVLYTGRTVRAALEALVEFGRPQRIELAVLVDRGGREMPIEANYAPFKVNTKTKELVNVNFDADSGEDQIILERE